MFPLEIHLYFPQLQSKEDTLLSIELFLQQNPSNVIESAIGTVINSRQKENKRMSWTRDGAHNILQIRTSIASKTWDRDWEDAFEVLISA